MSDAINPDHYKRLPAEAIEIIEAAIDNAPSNQAALLHGQVLKYILRCWDKNGIEDLRKAKWYLDRLIDSFDESEQHPVIKQSSTTEPPDGWRWLELGEVIRRGDMFLKDGTWRIYDLSIGKKVWEDGTSIRRNKFEVGEKVVCVDDKKLIPCEIDEYIQSKDSYVVKYEDGHYMHHWSKLAPYIEEQS